MAGEISIDVIAPHDAQRDLKHHCFGAANESLPRPVLSTNVISADTRQTGRPV